jgi:hypothetical protein
MHSVAQLSDIVGELVGDMLAILAAKLQQPAILLVAGLASVARLALHHFHHPRHRTFIGRMHVRIDALCPLA